MDELTMAKPDEEAGRQLLPRNRSLKTLLEHKFEVIEIQQREWLSVFGSHPDVGFMMLIYGPSGSGKTTFCLLLSRYLSTLGKVYYNSLEQGFSKSFQDQVVRAGITSDEEVRFMIGSRDELHIMRQKLLNGRPRFVVIDSLQFIDMTVAEFKDLRRSNPRCCFVLISWEASGKPKGDVAKALEYISDVKVRVKDGVATSMSRYGATQPYRIFKTKGPNGGGQYPLPLEEVNPLINP